MNTRHIKVSEVGSGAKRPGLWVLLSAAAALAFGTTGCGSLMAHQQVSRGNEAMKVQNYDVAVQCFSKAVQLDPTRVDAKLDLAAAYQAEIVPGGPADANNKYAQQAEATYKAVLAQDPNNAAADSGLGSVYLNDENDPASARPFYLKAAQLSPNDPDVYAALGAIDWQLTNQQVMVARNTLGSTNPDDPIVMKESPVTDKKICTAVRDKYQAQVADGIQMVQKSLSLRPVSADTMNSLNLLYRQQADLTCGENDTERAADLANANIWNTKAISERKVELAKQNVQGGVVVDTSSN